MHNKMKLAYKFASSVLGAALLCAGSDAFALTVGRARSVALLGQSLELEIPVHLEGEEATSVLCFDADVFYGDVKLDSNQVVVTSRIIGSTNSASVRILGQSPVNEPIVTVYFRGGCVGKTTRKYVLLADIASEVGVTAAPVSQPLQPKPDVPVRSVPVVSVPVLANPVVQSGPASSGPMADKALDRPRTKRSKLNEGQLTPEEGFSSSRSRLESDTRPRLKLAPLDLSVARDPLLKFSKELLLAPTDDPKKRADAIAFWRLLNLSAPDLAREEARLLNLESELKYQRERNAKLELALQDASARAEQLDGQKYSNLLVYGLLIALMCSGLALAYMWRKFASSQAGASPWWKGKKPVGESHFEEDDSRFDEADPALAVAPEREGFAGELVAAGFDPGSAVSEVDIQLDLSEPSKTPGAADAVQIDGQMGSQAQKLQSAGTFQGRDFSHSTTDGIRSMNMRELLDVRQQAEFFMTLGQYDEAIGMLEGSIKDSGESNPEIYLDLLRALHTLSRKPDFDHYRYDFNVRFSGLVPEFASFHHWGLFLESYTDIVERIVPLWPSHESLDFIESCLVRSTYDDIATGYDLNAFSDLLVLHGVASRILFAADSSPAPFSTDKIEVPPNVALLEDFPMFSVGTDSLPDSQADNDNPSLGMSVDLDLSDEPSNLIEFDAEGLSGVSPLGPTKT